VDYDLLVIGSGTAGSTAASTATALGARTAIVEQDGFVGTCLGSG
jgi:pyruvate/2-oxoglutarate dehydrogenase complex dihydrolipoamide dehydrogenase (E3) component